MQSIRVWESVYTRFLEIESSSDGSPESLRSLLEQLLTIVEIVPDDVDPAVEFELYVLGKLCRSAGNTIDRFLADHDGAQRAPDGSKRQWQSENMK